jgi:hypothetical protein
MILMDEMHYGGHVDGMKFDVTAIFEDIIKKFGVSKKAKNGTVPIL